MVGLSEGGDGAHELQSAVRALCDAVMTLDDGPVSRIADGLSAVALAKSDPVTLPRAAGERL
jgi:hypothetical protein